jgi:signal transduction histidine kinase
MAERTHLLNGTFTVQSGHGEGTTVRATFAPLPPEDEVQEETV